MGLRIVTNIASLRASRALGDTLGKVQSSMEKLSSGYRINKSADDAAGLAISETLRAKVRSSEQAKRNANDGVSLIQTAEGSMNEITNALVRLRELAVQSSSDTIGNRERTFVNKEYVELVREIDRIAAVTEFNSIKLLGGSDPDHGLEELTIHIGPGDGFVPNTDTLSLNLDDIALDAKNILSLNDGSEIGPESMDDLGDFQRSQAAEKLTTIDTALNQVAGKRAVLGAMQNRLYSAISNLGVQIENMTTSKSRIKDVDFAEETAKLTQSQIIGQSGASVLSQANSAPELVLTLLR
ncbi:MAG: flagellin [Oligoflexales bacterium]